MRKTLSVFGGEILIVAMICLLTLLLIPLLINSLSPSHPDDQQLIDNYVQHKDEFNRLAQMLTQETRLLVIFPESGNCQIEKQQLVNNTTDMKCDAYVQLFRSLGLKWAYSGAEPLWLTVSTYGLSVSGSEKGYFYTSLLEPLDGTLVDNIEEAGDAQRPLYRHIENNWYLFYDAN